MKFTSIRIENLRAIRSVSMNDLGQIVLIAGANGAGKSTIVDAISLWCYQFWRYPAQRIDAHRYMAGGVTPLVAIGVEQTPSDQDWLRRVAGGATFSVLNDAERYIGTVRLSEPVAQPNFTMEYTVPASGGSGAWGHTWRNVPYRDPAVDSDAPMIDFIGAHRHMPVRTYTTFNSEILTRESDEQRRNLQNPANVQGRAQYLKDYFWSLDQGDWAETKDRLRRGESITEVTRPDAFTSINESLKRVLPYLRFAEIRPGAVTSFLFTVHGRSLVELDELSSGEKEIIMFVSELERTRPRNSVIIIDEAELHLNSETEPRLLGYLADFANVSNNQLILTTHSTSMISVARSSGAQLWRIDPVSDADVNQATVVASDDELFAALRILAGDLSIITTSDRFLFLEGKEGRSSFDARIVRALQPTLLSGYTVIGVGSADNTERVLSATQRVLNEGIPFGTFAAILDRDRRSTAECQRLQASSRRLMVWPYCMIENILLDATAWSAAVRDLGFPIAADEVNDAFRLGASNIAEEEMALRLDERISGFVKRQDFKDFVGQSVTEKMQALIAYLRQNIADLATIQAEIRSQIGSEICDGSFRRTMHGKNLAREAAKLLGVNTPRDQLLSLVANKMHALGVVPADVVETIRRAISP